MAGADDAIDLVVGGRDDAVLLVFVGNGDATFVDPPSLSYTFEEGVGGLDDLTVADLNRDGAPDVVASNPGSGRIFIAFSSGSTFQAASIFVGDEPQRLLVHDVNMDNIPDIIVVATATRIVVLRRNGDGTFAEEAAIATDVRATDLAIVDVNGDGRLDIVAALMESGIVQVFEGIEGGFQPGQTIELAAEALAVRDFTGDGLPDLLASAGTQVFLLAGENGHLADPSPPVANVPASRILVEDMNGDGAPDFVALDEEGGIANVFLGNGTGGFSDEPVLAVEAGESTSGLAIADFDGDGRPDLALSAPGAEEVVPAVNPLRSCAGDCDADQVVSVSEVVRAVNVALASLRLTACSSLDVDRDGRVTIDELVAAVERSINGCGMGKDAP